MTQSCAFSFSPNNTWSSSGTVSAHAAFFTSAALPLPVWPAGCVQQALLPHGRARGLTPKAAEPRRASTITLATLKS